MIQMTNFEKIKQMSVEEIVNADKTCIELNCMICHRMNCTEYCVGGCRKQLKKWLESEVDME